MGSVWRAHHLVLDAPVAVKMLAAEVARGPEARARFLREARAAANLRSPNVVQILDYGVEGELPFIIMELLEGEALSTRLGRLGRLGADETASIITQVARAIGRAHEAGIVHRDLKPENVFLVRNDDEEVAKVLDFGVAKMGHEQLTPSGSRTRTGSMLGTPCYMSPEQAQGNKTIDYRSDLWSLGVIAYECLVGDVPFESDGLGDLVLQICVKPLPTPSERAAVPHGFDGWFARAIAREPEERFQSARELADALKVALSGDGLEAKTVDAPPVHSVEERQPSLRRRVLANAPAAPNTREHRPLVVAGTLVGFSALALGLGIGLLAFQIDRSIEKPAVSVSPKVESVPAPLTVNTSAVASAASGDPVTSPLRPESPRSRRAKNPRNEPDKGRATGKRESASPASGRRGRDTSSGIGPISSAKVGLPSAIPPTTAAESPTVIQRVPTAASAGSSPNDPPNAAVSPPPPPPPPAPLRHSGPPDDGKPLEGDPVLNGMPGIDNPKDPSPSSS